MKWTMNTVAAAAVTRKEVDRILAKKREKRFKASKVRERLMIEECVGFVR